MVGAMLIKGIKIDSDLAISIIKFLAEQKGLAEPDDDNDDFYLDDEFDALSPVLKLAMGDYDDSVVIGFISSYGNGRTGELWEVTDFDNDKTENDFYREVDNLGIRQLLPSQQRFRMFICTVG